jgi:hypothetical protein
VGCVRLLLILGAQARAGHGLRSVLRVPKSLAMLSPSPCSSHATARAIRRTQDQDSLHQPKDALPPRAPTQVGKKDVHGNSALEWAQCRPTGSRPSRSCSEVTTAAAPRAAKPDQCPSQAHADCWRLCAAATRPRSLLAQRGTTRSAVMLLDEPLHDSNEVVAARKGEGAPLRIALHAVAAVAAATAVLLLLRRARR